MIKSKTTYTPTKRTTNNVPMGNPSSPAPNPSYFTNRREINESTTSNGVRILDDRTVRARRASSRYTTKLQEQEMKFEYKLVYAGQSNAALDEEMNALGKAGWRLVNQIQMGGSSNHLIFEREVGSYRVDY